MNEGDGTKDLRNVSNGELKAELEKRTEKKYETWGRGIEGKINSFERKLPGPVSAFLDALCICIIVAGAAWGFKKFNWINEVPSWKMLGVVFCSVFIISLIYRLAIKPRYRKK